LGQRSCSNSAQEPSALLLLLLLLVVLQQALLLLQGLLVLLLLHPCCCLPHQGCPMCCWRCWKHSSQQSSLLLQQLQLPPLLQLRSRGCQQLVL
jgi:hypothetical protein